MTIDTIAIIALAIIIILQNTESVETRILLFTITMPRALLLPVTGVIGSFAGKYLPVVLRREKTAKK